MYVNSNVYTYYTYMCINMTSGDSPQACQAPPRSAAERADETTTTSRLSRRLAYGKEQASSSHHPESVAFKVLALWRLHNMRGRFTMLLWKTTSRPEASAGSNATVTPPSFVEECEGTQPLRGQAKGGDGGAENLSSFQGAQTAGHRSNDQRWTVSDTA